MLRVLPQSLMVPQVEHGLNRSQMFYYYSDY